VHAKPHSPYKQELRHPLNKIFLTLLSPMVPLKSHSANRGTE
jgi:hypothetical protein